MFIRARTQTTIHNLAIEVYMRYGSLNVAIPDSNSCELIPSCFKLVISLVDLVDIVVITSVTPLFSFDDLAYRGIISLFECKLSIEFVLDEHCPI